jgi:hypothetical protein
MKDRPTTQRHTGKWLFGLFAFLVGGFILYMLITSTSAMAQGIGLALIVALLIGLVGMYLYRQQKSITSSE